MVKGGVTTTVGEAVIVTIISSLTALQVPWFVEVSVKVTVGASAGEGL